MKNQILFNILLVSLLIPTTTFAQSLEVSSPDSDHAEKNAPHQEIPKYHCTYRDKESYRCVIDGHIINIAKPRRWLDQNIFEATYGYNYFIFPDNPKISPYGITLSAIYLYSVSEYYQVGGGVTMHTILLFPSIHIENRLRIPMTNYMAWYLSVPFQISYQMSFNAGHDIAFVPGIRTGFQIMLTQTENYGLGMVVNGGIDICFSNKSLYYFRYSDNTYLPFAPSVNAGFLLTF